MMEPSHQLHRTLAVDCPLSCHTVIPALQESNHCFQIVVSMMARAVSLSESHGRERACCNRAAVQVALFIEMIPI